MRSISIIITDLKYIDDVRNSLTKLFPEHFNKIIRICSKVDIDYIINYDKNEFKMILSGMKIFNNVITDKDFLNITNNDGYILKIESLSDYENFNIFIKTNNFLINTDGLFYDIKTLSYETCYFKIKNNEIIKIQNHYNIFLEKMNIFNFKTLCRIYKIKKLC